MQPLAATGGPSGERARWSLVVAMALATFMAMLDMTVVAMALPAITTEFGTTPATSEWVVIGYVVALVGLSLPVGGWLDTVGRRSAVVVGLIGFAVSSLLVGLSPNIESLIAARALQGSFAAILFSVTPAIATSAVPQAARGRAMSLIASVGPLGAVTGYAAGGLVLDTVGWQWAFYINVPITAVVLVMVSIRMPSGRGLAWPTPAMAVEAGVLVIAAVALLTGLTLAAGHGIAWLLTSIVSVPPVILWSRSTSGRSMRSVLRPAEVRAPHISLLAEATAFGVATFLLPFCLQSTSGGSATRAGLLLLTLPVTSIVASLVGGLLVDAFSARAVAAIGTSVISVAMLSVVPADPAWGAWSIGWRIALIGAGAGLFAGANQTLAVTAASRDQLARVGASTSVARQLGFALGPAVTTTLWAVSGYTIEGMRYAFALAAVLALAAACTLFHQPLRATQKVAT
jgi:MFS family permease